MTYPRVADEFETIRKVAEGYSLARFGDGELKIIFGAGYSRELPNPLLTEELGRIIAKPSRSCLVGIPTYDPAGPKYTNWLRHQARFEQVISDSMAYYSAFVTRPDSSPWINCKEYAELVESVWAGKRVIVVCELKGSMLKTVQRAATKVRHIPCPRYYAYAKIHDFYSEIVARGPDLAIISAGPTATCLANRLAVAGIQAVDLGSAGGFLGRLLRP